MRGTLTAIAVALLLSMPPLSAQAGPVSDIRWRQLGNRLFPKLEALKSADAAIVHLLDGRRARIGACKHIAPCVLKASIWTSSEIEAVADRVVLTRRSQAPSPTTSADDEFKAGIARELQGVNTIIEVYGLGAAPEYPAIDGPADAPGTPPFNLKVADAVLLGEAGSDDPSAAFDPSIAMALALLDANHLYDAIAFDPLDQTFNGPAAVRARSLDWRRFQYTAIIVPGKGPDDPVTELSLRSQLRARLAAKKFFEGVAPFIIVSGGAVHPKGTKFVEAIEMRKALIERFGVPADCIVVEPYARHTTTNLRNATRLMIGLGGPLERDMLIVTDTDQNDYIESPEFEKINRVHLGYQPGKVGTRLSPTELTYKPSASSLRLNPADPLDP
ncbi:MAG: YdcF family protein [Sphingobium limneticum]